MNFADFHAATRRLANGRFFTTAIEAIEWKTGEVKLLFKIYLEGRGIVEAPTAEAALAAAIAPVTQNDLDEVGAPPAAVKPEPVADIALKDGKISVKMKTQADGADDIPW